MKPIRVLLADDHVVVRQGLRALIDQQKDMHVVGEADDGLQLLEAVDQYLPDVAVVDLKMPNLNGVDAAIEIRKRHPSMHIVILTMHADRAYIEHALQIGVSGYVLKEENILEMCTAIRQASQGNRYLSQAVTKLVPDPSPTASQLDELMKLTLRERQVFQQVAEGKTSIEISGILGISVRTVEGHRAHMMAKLGLRTPLDFVRFALKNGIFMEAGS